MHTTARKIIATVALALAVAVPLAVSGTPVAGLGTSPGITARGIGTSPGITVHGVSGESKDSKHKSQIEVLPW